MKVGIVGLGKIGMPIALALNVLEGHSVWAYDVNPDAGAALADRTWPHREAGIADLLAAHTIAWVPLHELVGTSDVVLVAVQTPHGAEYEGVTRLPESRQDFGYRHLAAAVSAISDVGVPTNLVVLSTVLPGTHRDLLARLLGPHVTYVYNPCFIAMGTTVADFVAPELVLLGANGPIPDAVHDLHGRRARGDRVFTTDVTTAEGVKVLYNTFITAKTVLGNLYGELAERVGMNADDLHAALSLGTDRLWSPRYLRAGMGDGGPCHPRDNIALSWLARQVGLSYDLFESLMVARERHAEWLASLIPDGAVIFGVTFKPESDITTGSPALLVAELLREQGKTFTHGEDPEPGAFNFVATRHDRYQQIVWPDGSTVLDPFGFIADQPGVTVHRIGRP